MEGELNVLALIKGEDFYIYVYDDSGLQLLIDVLQEHAADPELNLSWFDAGVLGDRARAQSNKRQPVLPASRPVL